MALFGLRRKKSNTTVVRRSPAPNRRPLPLSNNNNNRAVGPTPWQKQRMRLINNTHNAGITDNRNITRHPVHGQWYFPTSEARTNLVQAKHPRNKSWIRFGRHGKWEHVNDPQTFLRTHRPSLRHGLVPRINAHATPAQQNAMVKAAWAMHPAYFNRRQSYANRWAPGFRAGGGNNYEVNNTHSSLQASPRRASTPSHNRKNLPRRYS